ncbi:MAG: hypothetical protein ACI3ZR_10745, partial [bacterium]
MQYRQLTLAVLLICTVLLVPFPAQAAHDFSYIDEGDKLSIYIGRETNPFVIFKVYSAATTGDNESYRDFFTEGNGINKGTEQQALANGLCYLKDLLGQPTVTPTVNLKLMAPVIDNAYANSDIMDNSNTALGNYFLLADAGEIEKYAMEDCIIDNKKEIYGESAIWIHPRKRGWNTDDIGNLSRNPDNSSLTSVIVHEMIHALGMIISVSGDDYSTVGDYIFIKDAGGDIYKSDELYLNKYTQNVYDVYGHRAQAGDKIIGINRDEKDDYSAAEGRFYAYAYDGYLADGGEKPTYDSGCYFSGEHVNDVLTVNGTLAQLYFPMDSAIAVPGLPINGYEQGRAELSHIELQNSFLSHQSFRNWSVPMEAELAMLEDLGYKLDRRNFFGYSIYNSGIDYINDNVYYARNAEGTKYLTGQ